MSSSEATTAEAGKIERAKPVTGGFACTNCGKVFKTKLGAVGHYNCVHTGIRPKDAFGRKKKKTQPKLDEVTTEKSSDVHLTSIAELQLKPIDEIKLSTSESSNGITISLVNFLDYMVPSVPKYIETDSELEIYSAHLTSGIPLLLVGAKGTGKTLSFAYFSAKSKLPLIQFDCSEDVKRANLLGRFVPKGDNVEFLLGVLPTAIEVANQRGAAVLVFEEVNALAPNSQKLLNQLLDWRNHVYIQELGKTYALKEGVKLLIAATMNPSNYGGVFQVNEDLKSRFAQIFVPYPERAFEKKIVKATAPEISEDLLRNIILLANETRKNESTSYALSPRDVSMFAKVYATYSKSFKDQDTALKFALKNCVVDKYEDRAERATIVNRISSIFGIDVSGISSSSDVEDES